MKTWTRRSLVVVAAALLALWVRSLGTRDAIRVERDRRVILESWAGRVALTSHFVWRDLATDPTTGTLHPFSPRARVEYETGPALHWPARDLMFGFTLHEQGAIFTMGIRRFTEYSSDVRLPHWLIAAVCLVPQSVSLVRRRRTSRRRALGLCLACGYDLRSSNEMCPECGRPTAQSQRTRCATSSPG